MPVGRKNKMPQPEPTEEGGFTLSIPILPTELSLGVHAHEDGAVVSLTVSNILSMGNTYFITRNQAEQLAAKLKMLVRQMPKAKKIEVPHAPGETERASGLVIPGGN